MSAQHVNEANVEKATASQLKHKTCADNVLSLISISRYSFLEPALDLNVLSAYPDSCHVICQAVW
jgi:hypothetical protein